jgi:hypothetical protein
MQREPNTAEFTYFVDVRLRTDKDGPWATLATGHFLATGGVRKGAGDLTLDVSESRRVGFSKNAEDATKYLSVTYRTDSAPILVELAVESEDRPFKPGAKFVYSYTEHEDGRGAIGFELTGFLIGGIFSPADTLEITSRWLPTGAGRGEANITAGEATGFQIVECWDAAFAVTYASDPTKALLLGEPSACADVSGS